MLQKTPFLTLYWCTISGSSNKIIQNPKWMFLVTQSEILLKNDFDFLHIFLDLHFVQTDSSAQFDTRDKWEYQHLAIYIWNTEVNIFCFWECEFSSFLMYWWKLSVLVLGILKYIGSIIVTCHKQKETVLFL